MAEYGRQWDDSEIMPSVRFCGNGTRPERPIVRHAHLQKAHCDHDAPDKAAHPLRQYHWSFHNAVLYPFVTDGVPKRKTLESATSDRLTVPNPF